MNLRRNYDELINDSFGSKPLTVNNGEQYTLLLEFDLKRQKQKNAILQERLKNKQIFITQMKKFQQQLTIAYQQCKNELVYAKQKIQRMQNMQFRQLNQEITQLKHLLSQKTQTKHQKSYSKDQIKNNKINYSNQSKEVYRQSRSIDYKKSIPVSNYATKRQSNCQILQNEIIKQIKKVTEFINHFLNMTKCYYDEDSQQKLSRRLKNGWKWIKLIVKQWDKYKQVASFKQKICKILKLQQNTQNQTIYELLKQKNKTFKQESIYSKNQF